jgi:ribonuclease P protein component
MSNKFYSGEHLKSAKEIQRLFEQKSASVTSYPLRLVYGPMQEQRGNYPIQVGFTVPKRRYKKAVDRNRIKRLMREAFRLNKELLLASLPEDSPQYAWMILYTGKEEIPYRQIERKMRKVINAFLGEAGKISSL